LCSRLAQEALPACAYSIRNQRPRVSGGWSIIRLDVPVRRDGREAEGGGLLNRYRVKSSIEGSNPSLSAIWSFSPRICHLPAVNSPHLAGKPRFFELSENHIDCDCPAFVPRFSERNRGSSFFEWKWTAGSMSRLDGDMKSQTRSTKNGCRVRDSARSSYMDTATLLPAETLNICAESTCNFDKVHRRRSPCIEWMVFSSICLRGLD
jgi:hypothetical protein